MKKCFVRTLNYQRFEELCEELLGQPAGVEMAAVVSRAGRGKTTASERIVTMNKACVYLLYKEKDSHNDLLREMCFSLGGERPHYRRHCQEMIQDEMAGQRRLVIVDDADRMPSSCLNTLRNIHDICLVPVLMAGEEALKRKLERERRLISRTRRIMVFGPASQPDVAGFYKDAMGHVPNPPELAALTRHSGGDFRNVIKDALAIERIMKSSGLKSITREAVREAVKGGNHDD